MGSRVRQATIDDLNTVTDVLHEAADWIDRQGLTLWSLSELSLSQISQDIHDGLFFIGEREDHVAGVLRFQLSDDVFWPDALPHESAFIHRLAVRRQFAGAGVSTALLSWALERTALLQRKYLRLDCDAARSKLRRIY